MAQLVPGHPIFKSCIVTIPNIGVFESNNVDNATGIYTSDEGANTKVHFHVEAQFAGLGEYSNLTNVKIVLQKHGGTQYTIEGAIVSVTDGSILDAYALVPKTEAEKQLSADIKPLLP